ncbi:MAG: ATP-binding protein [Alphaproteobacteria bacterium]
MTIYARIVERVTAFLDWFIPSHLKENEESRRRIRTFLVSHVAGPPFGGVVAGYLVYLYPNFAAWGLTAGVLTFLVFPFLLRWTGRYEEVALASLLHFIALIFFVAFYSGGAVSGALSWALTVPIICVFFVGGWYRLTGFVAVAVGFAVLIVPYALGIELPNKFEGGSNTVDLVLLLAAAGYITVMALAYINLYEYSIERLRWAKDAAESANRAKSEFLATMSHELRTPLNAVIGFSQMMSNEALGPIGNPRYLEYSRDIERSGSHLLEIIADILDIAKIESGRFDLSIGFCQPQRIVDRANRIAKPLAKESGVELDADLAEDLPIVVGDERLLRQVLINLLTNAIKFSPPGATVAINGWQQQRPDMAELVLTVRDQGCGIAPADIERVLQPFEQVESAYQRRHGGIGLGLPLCKRIVELHRGTLSMESELGKGTCVTVRVPVATDDSHELTLAGASLEDPFGDSADAAA